MIISNLTGGLGNQMFQYALGRHLSLLNKTELKLHFTSALFNTKTEYELDVFNIRADLASNQDLARLGICKNRILNRVFFLLDERSGIQLNRNIITDRIPYYFRPEILSIKKSVYLQGYWSNSKYFDAIKKTLVADFAFKKKLDKTNQKILDLINNANSVSIHVRRGDYVTNKRNSKSLLDMAYYMKSIDNISKKVRRPVFFVFSDDIPWCKQNFDSPHEYHFVADNQGRDSYKDLWLMSKCKHNIIAKSTFSWWASWLNNYSKKIIISPN